jgi:hypothetical protein
MVRISRGDDGVVVDSFDRAREGVRRLSPGRYKVDEVRGAPFPFGHTSRDWGHLIRELDCSIADERRPWLERTSIG